MIITPAGYEVAAITVLIAVLSSIVNKVLINRNRMEAIQERTKELQKEMTAATKENNDKKVTELNSELMKLMSEQMKMSFKPMLVTYILFIIILGLINTMYEKAGFVAQGVPLLGDLTWLGWYILIAVLTSLIVEMIYSNYRKMKKAKVKK
jgi:uncharacterized membrane protein (DUF106 family)